MSEKNNKKYYEKLIALEDEIYDSDILDDYDAFILNCMEFAKKNIIPLSQNGEELNKILEQCKDFLDNKISEAELKKYYCQLGEKIRFSLDGMEKEIHIFMTYFLDFHFLRNIPDEEQQDSDICYLLCNLYRIKNNLELCDQFYNFIRK